MMRTVSVTKAKQSLGHIIDVAQREPIVIQKQHRDVAILLSMYDYEKLRGAQIDRFNIYCDMIAQRVQARGLTEEKLADILCDE